MKKLLLSIATTLAFAVLIHANQMEKKVAHPEHFYLPSVESEHFDFEGGDATNLWSIFLNIVTLDGADVEAGDELAIFDGDKMVGQWTFSGPVLPGTYMQSLLAYKVLLSQPGYSPGNSFSFKLWDSSAAKELESPVYSLLTLIVRVFTLVMFSLGLITHLVWLTWFLVLRLYPRCHL